MSYGVHIERDEGVIPLEEWLDFIATDSELTPHDAFEESSETGESIRVDAPGLASWTAHPEGEPVWFDWSRGRITVGNPDEPTIRKMAWIAGRLSASVVGDEGETYEA
jgi:hypothetical protein